MRLPKTYDDPFGNYPQHVGKPKISYSQYTSWTDPLYKNDYIRSYFMGEKQEPGIYAKFGSACGKYLETEEVDETWLSEDDVMILRKLSRPLDAKYEGEIVIDRGWYVIQGFIDQEYKVDGKLYIKDLKTGNIKTKVPFYSSDKYQQTTIYTYGRLQENFDIEYSGVILLGRKGDGDRWGNLRLSGEIKEIPTPYSNERAKKALINIDVAAIEISNAYELFLKLNN